MPDQKISQLTDGGSAQSTDQIPINRGGVNYRLNASTLGGPGSSSSGQVLYNSSGAIAGDAGLTYDAATDTLSLGSTGRYAISTDLFLNRDQANVFSLRNGTTAQGFRLYQTTDASTTNYTRGGLGYNTYSTLKYFTIYSQGAGTESANTPIVIQPGGTGAFVLGPPPDGASTGGNQRGNYAVDLQIIRGAATQVASGTYAFVAGRNNTASATGAVVLGDGNTVSNECYVIGATNQSNQQYAVALGRDNLANGSSSACIGRSNTTSNTQAVAIGYINTASGTSSTAIGYNSTASGGYSTAIGVSHNIDKTYSIGVGTAARPAIEGSFTYAGGNFSATGDRQFETIILFATTTNNTPTNLAIQAIGGGQLTLPASRVWLADLYIVAASTGGTDSAGFVRRCMIKRDNANNTALVGSVQTIGTDIGSNAGAPPAGWAVAITANDASGFGGESLQIQVTGATSTTIRWFCTAKLFELGNP
jgi:hypothetical protein